MKITSLAYSRPEDDPKKKNPNRIAPSPSPLGVAALATGGGGSSSGSGGITIGRVLYTTAGNVVGSAPIEVNALNSTYLTVTSGAAAAGVVVGVAGGGANENIVLTPKGSGVVEQRNGTTAQTFRIYNTFTDASNYERWDLSGTSLIFSKAGTGADREVTFGNTTGFGSVYRSAQHTFKNANAATTWWQINTVGHLVAGTDNTYDIGASGATRPRNVYVANDLVVSNSITTSGSLGIIFAAGSSRIGADAGNGTLVLQNNAKTDFSRLQFGGTSAAFGALGRDGAGIKVVGGDGTSVSWLKIPGVTVANLPAAATAGLGARSFVTDALAPTFGATVTGGGAVATPVYSDGANWLVG